MRVFRRRKKSSNYYGGAADGPALPDLAYQMAAEQAARFVAQNPMSQYSYNPYNITGQEAAYSAQYVPTEDDIDEQAGYGIGDRIRGSSSFNFIGSLMGRGRSSSRERVRAGSPSRFSSRPGSPVYIQPRASSPYQYVIREGASSPNGFAPLTRSSSSDIARRHRLAKLSQNLQYLEKQQRRQDDQAMAYSGQYDPYYQQASYSNYSMMNPNVNMNAYSMMQQPQMYSYY